MKVKELIEELQKVENKELYIRIHGTSPDGWTYYNMVEWCEEEVVFEDDDEFGKYRKRFVISGGMF
jgi:hypothetical protein